MFAPHFRHKGILNKDKIIFEWGCDIAWWYAKNLLLKMSHIGSVMANNYDPRIVFLGPYDGKSSEIVL